jgi:hypothetical protein
VFDKIAGIGYGCRNSLGYPVSAIDSEWVCAQINEDYFDLTPVIGIDSAWSVEYGYSVTGGKTASGPHLYFVTLWNIEHESGWNQGPFAGLDSERNVESGRNITPA